VLELAFFDEDRARAGLDGDAAEVLDVEYVERDGEPRGEVLVNGVEQQIVEEQLVAVAALLVDGLVVVLQADDSGVIIDADKRRECAQALT
jgi:hypothetical protein